MAVRQYIGARYVPKFSDVNDGVWDNSYSYEALTIVKHGNDYYTSKIPVPVGIDITNTQYWVKTGDYNGAIALLNTQIQALENAKVNNISNRTFLMIGDSYDVINPNYSWIDIAMSKIGADHYYKRSAGGYGFAPASGNTWLSLLQNNPVPSEEITDIIIGGGANDTTISESTLLTSMRSFDDYVKTNYPNLKNIYLAYMGWNHSASSNAKNDQIYAMRAYLSNAKKLGWKFLTGVENVLKNPSYILAGISDKLHPNPDGVVQLGECVALAFNTGFAKTSSSFNAEFTLNNTLFANGVFIIRQTLIDNILEIKTPDIALTTIADIRGYFTLGSCNDLLTAFSQNKYFMCDIEYNNRVLPAIIYSSTPNDINIWLRTPETIPSGSTLHLIANTYTELL